MGLMYTITNIDWASSASADTFETAVAVKTGASSRARIRKLTVAGAGPQVDDQIAVQIKRTTGAGAGTSTAITAANLARPDPDPPNPVNLTG